MPVEAGTSDIDGLVLPLEPGFAVTGIVLNETRSGDARDFGVSLRASEPAIGAGQVKWAADHASFTIADVTPASYRLEVSPPMPLYVKSATVGGQDILAAEVSIEGPAQTIQIVLRDDGGAIQGEVANQEGQPVASAIMLLRGAGRPVIATAGPAGHFSVSGLAPGEYLAYAWDDAQAVAYADPDWMRRNAPKGVAVTVEAGQSSQVRLTQLLVPAP